MNEIFKACTGKTFFDQQYILRELYCTCRVFFRLLIENLWKVYLRTRLKELDGKKSVEKNVPADRWPM